MWYVIGEFLPGRIAWWGAYEKEEDADTIAKQVNGAAIMVKDWARFSELMKQAELNVAVQKCFNSDVDLFLQDKQCQRLLTQ